MNTKKKLESLIEDIINKVESNSKFPTMNYMPFNVITGDNYKGINSVSLSILEKSNSFINQEQLRDKKIKFSNLKSKSVFGQKQIKSFNFYKEDLNRIGVKELSKDFKSKINKALMNQTIKPIGEKLINLLNQEEQKKIIPVNLHKFYLNRNIIYDSNEVGIKANKNNLSKELFNWYDKEAKAICKSIVDIFSEEMKINVSNGNKTEYNLEKDQIILKDINNQHVIQDYLSDFFHQYSNWMESKHRDNDLKQGMKDLNLNLHNNDRDSSIEKSSKEKLVAELTSKILIGELGMPYNINKLIEPLKEYKDKIKQKPLLLYKVSEIASKRANYFMKISNIKTLKPQLDQIVKEVVLKERTNKNIHKH